jgi:hypothetical protein
MVLAIITLIKPNRETAAVVRRLLDDLGVRPLDDQHLHAEPDAAAVGAQPPDRSAYRVE